MRSRVSEVAVRYMEPEPGAAERLFRIVAELQVLSILRAAGVTAASEVDYSEEETPAGVAGVMEECGC